MSKLRTRSLVGAACTGIIAAAIFGLRGESPPMFDPQKLDAAARSRSLIQASDILPEDAAFICALGSYTAPEAVGGDPDPRLLTQMTQSSVPEGAVRIATFDAQSELLHEIDMPMWTGRLRIVPRDGDFAFCAPVIAAPVEIEDHDHYRTISFLGRSAQPTPSKSSG